VYYNTTFLREFGNQKIAKTPENATKITFARFRGWRSKDSALRCFINERARQVQR